MKKQFNCWPWDFLLVSLLLIFLSLLLPYQVNGPLNDDWAYSRDVLESSLRNHLWITGYEMAWTLPQIFLGWLVTSWFGFSFILLRWLGLMGLGGVLFFSHLILLRHKVDGKTRLITLLSIASFAPLFLVSFSFMGDAWFLCFWMAVLYFWEPLITDPSMRKNQFFSYLLGGGVFALLGVAQRQTAFFLVLVMGMMVLIQWHWRLRQRSRSLWPLLVGVILFGLVIFIYRWWLHQDLKVKPQLITSPHPGRILLDLHASLFYWGWLLFPFAFELLKQFKPMLSQRHWWWIAIGLAIVTFLRGIWKGNMPYLSNQISYFGVFGPNEVLEGVRPFFLPSICNIIFTFFFGLLGLLNLWTVLKKGSQWVELCHLKFLNVQNILKLKNLFLKKGFFSVVTAGIYLLFMILRGPIFDRYLTVAFITFLIVLSAFSFIKTTRLGIALGLVALNFIFVFYLISDYFEWNQTKLQAADFAQKKYGFNASEIDAGYEWVGWHSNVIRYLLKDSTFKAIVSFSPLPGHEVLERFSYQPPYPMTERTLYLLQEKSMR